jgi:hypothetical protein
MTASTAAETVVAGLALTGSRRPCGAAGLRPGSASASWVDDFLFDLQALFPWARSGKRAVSLG